jgi:Leucine-rich repeat (LRR) protein
VGAFSFRGLVNVNILGLSNNRLKHLQDDVFTSLKKLRTLYLDQNELGAVDARFLQDLESRGCELQEQQVALLDKNFFAGIENLATIYMSNN